MEYIPISEAWEISTQDVSTSILNTEFRIFSTEMNFEMRITPGLCLTDPVNLLMFSGL